MRQQGASPFVIMTLGFLIATSAVAIDISLPAVPQIAQRFQVNVESAQWVVTSYLLGFATGQIPIGLAVDRYGRRPIILIFILLYTAAGIVGATSPYFVVLIAARLAQGFCGAVGGVAARAIVTDIGGAKAPSLMALMTAILGLAPLFAPLLGGLLTESFGWVSTLYATAIYGLITLILAFRFINETHTRPADVRIGYQLKTSLDRLTTSKEIVSPLLLSCLPFAGYLAFITSSSTIVIETYGLSPRSFGLVFALAAVAYTAGAYFSRLLIIMRTRRFVLDLGMTAFALAGIGLVVIWLIEVPPLWALWICIVIYIGALSITVPLATTITLEQVPESTGFAAAVIGALQISLGAIGSIASASFYSGNENSMVIVMLLSVTLIILVRSVIPIGNT